jgi:hypothetical protein
MTNLELYIVFSYLAMFFPATNISSKFFAVLLWWLSPITFPMTIGFYLSKSLKK